MWPSNQTVYLSNSATDMRKSINGLSILVSSHLKHNPCDGAIYVFLNRLRNKVKLLYWDRNGFVLFYKILEKGRFKLSKFNDEIYTLDSAQLQWLLSGLNFEKPEGHPRLNYTEFC